MRVFIPCFCLIIILQLWSCASQSDPFSQEKTTTKGLKSKKATKESSKEVLEEEELDPSDATNDENQGINPPPNTTTSENGLGGTNNGGVKKEDKIEALSVISYSNILETTSAELPVQGQKVKLMIKNNHQQAMWYLMPVSGEKEMPNNGQFYLNLEKIPPFLAKQYGTNDNQLIELIYHGQTAQSFRAFYIEAGSSLLFRNYDLGTYQEGEYVPFWAIKGLEVNDKISLEEWLPFSVLSSPDIVIHNKTESGTAKWKNISESVAFPEPKINFIQAHGIRKHQIPVGVIR